MLVVTLYGAGLRRPFGSLPRIPDVPYRLWNSRWTILAADCLFAAFVLAMLFKIWQRISATAFILLFAILYVAGHKLSYKIPLLPSFFISLLMAAAAAVLVSYSSTLTVSIN